MYDVQWNIAEADRLVARMRKLGVELRKKPARSALGSAARVVTNAAKTNAMQVDDAETGRRIADNITQRFRSRYYRQTGDIMISVGVATDKGRIPKGNPDEGRKGNTPHWHLIELGTEQAGAEPFLRPALENNLDRATAVFAQKLDQQLDKLLKG